MVKNKITAVLGPTNTGKTPPQYSAKHWEMSKHGSAHPVHGQYFTARALSAQSLFYSFGDQIQ